jgi:hypothetical protein
MRTPFGRNLVKDDACALPPAMHTTRDLKASSEGQTDRQTDSSHNACFPFMFAIQQCPARYFRAGRCNHAAAAPANTVGLLAGRGAGRVPKCLATRARLPPTPTVTAKHDAFEQPHPFRPACTPPNAGTRERATGNGITCTPAPKQIRTTVHGPPPLYNRLPRTCAELVTCNLPDQRQHCRTSRDARIQLWFSLTHNPHGWKIHGDPGKPLSSLLQRQSHRGFRLRLALPGRTGRGRCSLALTRSTRSSQLPASCGAIVADTANPNTNMWLPQHPVATDPDPDPSIFRVPDLDRGPWTITASRCAH